MAQFNKATFFETGADEVNTKVGAMEFLQMFYLQPDKYTEREEQLVEALLEKTPPALEVWKEKIRDELDVALTTGRWPWTWEQLVKLLAFKLKGLERENITAGAEGGRDMSKYLADAVCYRCGEKGHLASTCSKVCPRCDIRCCRGATDKMECSVHGAEMPTAATTHAGGKPYFARQLEVLQDAWRAAHKVTGEVAAAVVAKEAGSSTAELEEIEKMSNTVELEKKNREEYFERFHN